MATKKETRGGARKGAGRKPKGVVQLNSWVLPDSKDWVKQQSVMSGKSPGGVIDSLVKIASKHPVDLLIELG